MKTAAIVSSRNDGYKEKERLIIHLTSLLETFDEVIYVDWNSPTQSFLYEILDDIPKTGRLKHFVIPPHIHNMFAEAIPDLPNCYDPLAINLAIRRTDADWITCTTLDIIPPFREDFIKFINTLDKNTFYSISRRETDYGEVLKNKDNLTEYRKYLNSTSFPRYFPAKVTPNDNYSIINCCGDFQLAHRDVFYKIKGYEENMCYKCFTDTNIQKKAVLNGFGLKVEYDLPIYHMSHENMLPQSHTTKIHKAADKKPPRYNDAYEWVECFTTSKNGDNWGLGDTEIEFEIF
jgi:hypothetical protein